MPLVRIAYRYRTEGGLPELEVEGFEVPFEEIPARALEREILGLYRGLPRSAEVQSRGDVRFETPLPGIPPGTPFGFVVDPSRNPRCPDLVFETLLPDPVPSPPPTPSGANRLLADLDDLARRFGDERHRDLILDVGDALRDWFAEPDHDPGALAALVARSVLGRWYQATRQRSDELQRQILADRSPGGRRTGWGTSSQEDSREVEIRRLHRIESLCFEVCGHLDAVLRGTGWPLPLPRPPEPTAPERPSEPAASPRSWLPWRR